MRKKPRPPEQQTPKDRICRAISLAYKAAEHGDLAGVERWLAEAEKDGYVQNSRDRRQLAFKLSQAGVDAATSGEA